MVGSVDDGTGFSHKQYVAFITVSEPYLIHTLITQLVITNLFKKGHIQCHESDAEEILIRSGKFG